MSGDLSTPGADAILNSFGAGTLYVKLHLGDPGTNGTSNAAAETDRIPVNAWTAAGAAGAGYRGISNTEVEEILNAAATENVTHVSFWSASSGGTCHFVAALAGTLNVTAADTIQIPIGALVIKFPVWT